MHVIPITKQEHQLVGKCAIALVEVERGSPLKDYLEKVEILNAIALLVSLTGAKVKDEIVTIPIGGADTNPALVDKHLDAVLRASGSGLRNYSLKKSLDDMRAAMRAAMAPPAPTVARPLPAGLGYLCYAWGESDHPVCRFVMTPDEVGQFFCDEWFGARPDAMPDCNRQQYNEAMAQVRAERDDPDGWDGTDEIAFRFEIGGITVSRCVMDQGAAAPVA